MSLQEMHASQKDMCLIQLNSNPTSHPSEVEVGLCKKFKASFDDTLALGSRSQL